MIDIEYLKRLAKALERVDPYDNKYAGFVSSLNNLEKKFEKLGNEIRKEVAKYTEE